jgi:hypothetical protein
MIGENRQLVTNEPVKFEIKPVEVQDCRIITDHFRGISKIYPNLIKENRRMSTCNRLDLHTLRISTDNAQKSPRSLKPTSSLKILKMMMQDSYGMEMARN